VSTPIVLPALVIFMHDLFTVLWIGGLLTMALVVMPAIRAGRQGTGGEAHGPGSPPPFLASLQSRMGVVTIVSMVGLVVTGVLLARRQGGAGLFRFDTAWSAVLSIKHALVAVLVVLSLLRRLLARRTPGAAGALLVVNAAVGVLVLALSAANAALSAA
jgi:hypothetical protein